MLVPSLHALRTVPSAAGFFETEHEATFQHAARRALWLVAGDGEYFICMEEASVYKVGNQLHVVDHIFDIKLLEQYQDIHTHPRSLTQFA